MRKIVFRMETRGCLVGFFIVMLVLNLGCIDSGNLPGMGPKEVSVDLSTPEGVAEAWVKYVAVGKYDEAYDLYCDDEYHDQVSASKLYLTKENFIRTMKGAEKSGMVTDLRTLKVNERKPITSSRLRDYYGIGTIVDEGYEVEVKNKWRNGLSVTALPDIVKYNGRWCIARGL